MSVDAFALLAGVLEVIASSAVALKICGIPAGIKKYKSIIKKKRKKIRSFSVISKNYVKYNRSFDF